jgi:hypothetical protein
VYSKPGLFGCHGNGYAIFLPLPFQALNVKLYTEEKAEGRKENEKMK